MTYPAAPCYGVYSCGMMSACLLESSWTHSSRLQGKQPFRPANFPGHRRGLTGVSQTSGETVSVPGRPDLFDQIQIRFLLLLWWLLPLKLELLVVVLSPSPRETSRRKRNLTRRHHDTTSGNRGPVLVVRPPRLQLFVASSRC